MRDLTGNAGEANFFNPISSTGLITITVPPRSRILINSFIRRGWFAGALEPTNTTHSDAFKLSKLTKDVPVPNTVFNPTAEARWHKSEQSARLLEPSDRIINCKR